MPLADVSPPADGREEPCVPLERSSLRGRWREVGRSGDDGGSFLTIIVGGPAFRILQNCQVQAQNMQMAFVNGCCSCCMSR